MISSKTFWSKGYNRIPGILWWTNIAIENGPFIDGLPIKNGDFPWQNVSSPEGINMNQSNRKEIDSAQMIDPFP